MYAMIYYSVFVDVFTQYSAISHKFSSHAGKPLISSDERESLTSGVKRPNVVQKVKKSNLKYGDYLVPEEPCSGQSSSDVQV